MPKMKTKRSAAKRFRRTGGGHFRRYKAFNSHIKTKKNAKRIRRLRKPGLVSPADEPRVRALLPYA
ncbi:MAG: 50S ribosomal protein L35 [Candidatus Hydrothermae bacterium]|nr:50S ribosomal protein L35 [Candidatus Hydrothermae bacterium]